MTTTVHPPLHPQKNTARVLRLIPTIHKPLDTNGTDVTVKLKRALRKAQSGATPEHLSSPSIIKVDGASTLPGNCCMTTTHYV